MKGIWKPASVDLILSSVIVLLLLMTKRTQVITAMPFLKNEIFNQPYE